MDVVRGLGFLVLVHASLPAFSRRIFCMPWRFSRPARLIVAVIAAQLVCLVVGVMIFASWLTQSVDLLLAAEDHGLAAGAMLQQAQGWLLLLAGAVVGVSGILVVIFFRNYEDRLHQLNLNLEDKARRRAKQLSRSRDAVIFGLAKLADTRDQETGGHLERMCQYVDLLAQELAPHHDELDAATLDALVTTAALHDIGKVAVPDAILRKGGPLTEEERLAMQQHPCIGGDTLMTLKQRWGNDAFLNTASQIAYGHHEKFDGSGYPFGLKGHDIPLAARIAALADVYDALRSPRRYKTGMSHADARAIIVKDRGTHFDPEVVDAFVAIENQFQSVGDAVEGQPSNAPSSMT